MKTFTIALILFLVACKQNPDGTIAVEDTVPIAEPDVSPPGVDSGVEDVCETQDHSCREPAYSSPATKEECERMNNWQMGDPDVFYFQINDKSPGGYIRVDKDGILIKYGYPENDITNPDDLPLLEPYSHESRNKSKVCTFYFQQRYPPIFYTVWTE